MSLVWGKILADTSRRGGKTKCAWTPGQSGDSVQLNRECWEIMRLRLVWVSFIPQVTKADETTGFWPRKKAQRRKPGSSIGHNQKLKSFSSCLQHVCMEPKYDWQFLGQKKVLLFPGRFKYCQNKENESSREAAASVRLSHSFCHCVPGMTQGLSVIQKIPYTYDWFSFLWLFAGSLHL